MDRYYEDVAKLYDRKAASGINALLAKRDYLSFNHNGLFLPSEQLAIFRSRIKSEEDLLDILHNLEKNTVRLGRLYLGSPTETMLGLDAGCGAGGCSIMINREYGCSMTGYTISPGQAEFANKAAEHYGIASNVRFGVGNYLELPEPSGKFDFIWACESTEHARDLRAMFSEFARVSKPHARCTIIAWTSQHGIRASGAAFKRVIDDHYLTDIKTPGEYIAAAQATGWNLAELVDITQPTAQYWLLRGESKNKTGSEEFMIPGFRDDAVRYMIYVFDKPVT